VILITAVAITGWVELIIARWLNCGWISGLALNCAHCSHERVEVFR